jgi:hypothetical protein
MANNTISFRNTELFDKGAIAESMPYIKNGLTYKSNNTSIHPRDEAGNIVFQENSETNPLLIIEPVTPNISTKSVLRVVDTTFQYFKFPVAASIDAVEIVTSDLELDLTDIESDALYAYYKPTADIVKGEVNSEYSGMDFGRVMDGLPQEYTNSYYINKEVKESGKDLRFRVKITHRFDGPDALGSIYFSIIKTGPNMELNRAWREGYASSRQDTVNYNQLIKNIAVPMEEICSAASGVRDGKSDKRQPWWSYWFLFVPNAIDSNQTRLTGNQFEAIDFVFTRDASKVPDLSKDEFNALRDKVTAAVGAYNNAINLSDDVYGLINLYEVQTVYIDEIIKNSEFEIGDVFSLGVQTGQGGHTIQDTQSYWSITDASKNVNEWNQEIL